MKPGTVAIIQARIGSTRLPGKVLMRLGRRSLLEYLVARLGGADSVDRVVVATTVEARDDVIAAEASRIGVDCFRGSEADVLGRYLAAASAYCAAVIVRVTADNPFTDPGSVDRVVARVSDGCDYAIESGLPVGITAEALSFECLEFIDGAAKDARLREHVTLYAKENPHMVRCCVMKAPGNCARPDLSYTVDHYSEYRRVRRLAGLLPDPHFSLQELIALADTLTDEERRTDGVGTINDPSKENQSAGDHRQL